MWLRAFGIPAGNCELQLNLLTPNVKYSWRTAPLTSKVAFCIFIQQIYVLNILNMLYTLRFFSLQNAVCFIILNILSVSFSSKCSLFHNSNVFGSCIIHILYTGCAKKKFRCQKLNAHQSVHYLWLMPLLITRITAQIMSHLGSQMRAATL